MREYIPKQLHIDREAYKQVISVVRRYDHICRAIRENEHDTIYASPVFRGDGGISRPTESKALHIARVNAELERQVKAVEQALNCFTPEEQEIILNHIRCGKPLKRKGVAAGPGKKDWDMTRKKQSFVRLVAYNLNLA